MMRSWIFSSGVRLSFVIAMKSHIGLVGIMRSISDQSRIKGMASTEEEAYRRIRESNPGLVVSDLKVLMVLSSEDLDVGSALDSGAMAVVCEEDFLSPEMEVMQSLLAAANNKKYVSNRARSRMKKPESIVESPQSLTQREIEILILMLKGASDRDISEHLLISIHTVKEYGKSIRRKYQVKSRLQLISALLGRRQAPAVAVPAAR